MAATIKKALGATRPGGAHLLVLFVPSVDRNGKAIDHDLWVDEALTVCATLFRGATAYPRGRGKWRDDERGGRLVTDESTIVTSYADARAMKESNLKRLRAFLHRMGRETNQGEIGIVVDGRYWGITRFDPEE